MGPVLGVLDDRYAGGATSPRPHLVRTPHFTPDGPQRPAPTPLGKAEAATYSHGEARLRIPSPHHQPEVDPPRCLASGATA